MHRKGATLASKDTIGIIPGSMGTASYIVKGLGNPDSFQSCSHGAGRVMGRKQAQRVLSKDEVHQAMKGITVKAPGDYTDEAPQAYKNIDQVMEDQKDLVKISIRLTPLAVMKG